MVSMDGVSSFNARALRSGSLTGDVSGAKGAEGSSISNAFAMVLDTENQREGRREGRREDATTLYGKKPSLQQKIAKFPPLQPFIDNSGGGRGGVWCYQIRNRLLNSAVWLNPKLIQVILCYCDSRRMDKGSLNPLHFYIISSFGI